VRRRTVNLIFDAQPRLMRLERAARLVGDLSKSTLILINANVGAVLRRQDLPICQRQT
jgi:hypothetical protein